MLQRGNSLLLEVTTTITLNVPSHAETSIFFILDGENNFNHRNSSHEKLEEGVGDFRLQGGSQCLPWRSFYWKQQMWKPFVVVPNFLQTQAFN